MSTLIDIAVAVGVAAIAGLAGIRWTHGWLRRRSRSQPDPPVTEAQRETLRRAATDYGARQRLTQKDRPDRW